MVNIIKEKALDKDAVRELLLPLFKQIQEPSNIVMHTSPAGLTVNGHPLMFSFDPNGRDPQELVHFANYVLNSRESYITVTQPEEDSTQYHLNVIPVKKGEQQKKSLGVYSTNFIWEAGELRPAYWNVLRGEAHFNGKYTRDPRHFSIEDMAIYKSDNSMVFPNLVDLVTRHEPFSQDDKIKAARKLLKRYKNPDKLSGEIAESNNGQTITDWDELNSLLMMYVSNVMVSHQATDPEFALNGAYLQQELRKIQSPLLIGFTQGNFEEGYPTPVVFLKNIQES
ncbi:MAG: hypothetical protein ABIH34_08170 [Nanoarchaeota archaeon]